MKYTSKDIISIGFEGKAISLALEYMSQIAEEDVADALDTLKLLHTDVTLFVEHPDLKDLANCLLDKKEAPQPIEILDQALPYEIYGANGIEDGALNQMETVMKLPVARKGALMPDAHQGYGLPIGGVLATESSIIPYAVGVDIGCRMCMSIFDLPVSMLEDRKGELKTILNNETRFGRDTFRNPIDHEILASPLFNEIDIVKKLKDRAAKQIGSSGGGNHFVEFGITEIHEDDHELGLKKGKYLALLSHSGSRGLGATIANHYTKIAMNQCLLPKEAKHLAWLDLNKEEGQEYWLVMNLAGDYASACHHQIHDRIAKVLNEKPLAMLENHHNFAWKEVDQNGKEYIVHRKGATPAGEGVLGVIPGSMTAPGFIVRGKGNPLSVDSAAHGAGRQMSRTAAKKTLQKSDVIQHLNDHGIELLGAGLDEAPMAYKDIHSVMEHQKDLVDIVGTFLPKVVRMCGDSSFKEVD
ncbi:RtcB family protein [Sediminitomix flava]|uniref:3'-phosphate/5'-hydroxy nucleic acid ligase n=1 Tax=Sediminitomix flava TaxID=379075 RepID=A0A315ZXX1_SEDFL|nr:RtcB family protein [Sediminitomix flava]PWJ42177.1 tRNA-splicing ligase RtcB [Sediminitomix flava]